jgi:hypothetical protein
MLMDILIPSREAAAFIGVSPATLENWRVRGEGPPFHKTPGRTGKVLYDPVDIEAWRAKRRFSSTAEAAASDA